MMNNTDPTHTGSTPTEQTLAGSAASGVPVEGSPRQPEPGRARSHLRHLRILGSVALAAFALGHLAEDDARAPARAPEPTIKRVKVATVRAAGESPGIWFPGVARAQRRSKLSFALAGRIVFRGPSLGDRVASGAVLARLDAREQTLAVEAAHATQVEAAVRQAEAVRDRDRVARLVADGAATTEELESLAAVVDAATAAVDAASARLGDAERQQGEAVLRAPYAGTVTAVFGEPEEYRAVGQPILELSGEGAVEVELAVPETIANGLSPATDVAVRRPSRSQGAVLGRIEAIGRAGGIARALFPVLVSLSGDILPGTSVEVALRPETLARETDGSGTSGLGASTRVVLPIDAIVDPSGRQPVVFRLLAVAGPGRVGEPRSLGGVVGRVERVEISIGALVAGWITVRGALTAGDRVVIAGQRGLLHDDDVAVVP